MTYETLTVDRPTPEVVVARLDRPERLNAMTFGMFDELAALQAEVDDDPAARVLVLTGAGRAFCAGMDLEQAGTLPQMSAAEMLRRQESWARAVTGFRRLRTPVIAAVHGAAAGAGMALALAADIRLASTTARFNAAFVRIGLSGGDVGTSWLLPRLVGFGRASELLLTGRFVEAPEALRIGMVTEVTEPEELMARTMEVADAIRGNSPLGMQLTKQALQTNVDAPSLEAAIELENRNQVLTTRTQDMAEALAAFRERRPPRFIGR
jgi:enoyl-CoA hydratase/carnithine racemase